MLLGYIFLMIMHKIGKFYRIPCLVRIVVRPLTAYKENFIHMTAEQIDKEVNTRYLFTPVRSHHSLGRGYFIVNPQFSGIQDHLPENYMYEYDPFPNIRDYSEIRFLYLKCIKPD